MSDHLDISERCAYYDRQADIVWIPLGSSDDVLSEETGWGLIDRDADTEAAIGIEIWGASRRLPEDLLAVLPNPPAAKPSSSA